MDKSYLTDGMAVEIVGANSYDGLVGLDTVTGIVADLDSFDSMVGIDFGGNEKFCDTNSEDLHTLNGAIKLHTGYYIPVGYVAQQIDGDSDEEL